MGRSLMVSPQHYLKLSNKTNGSSHVSTDILCHTLLEKAKRYPLIL